MIKINFIFPKNYKFKSKLFGFIDYETAIIVAIYGVFLYIILNWIFENVNIKIYIFISLYFPVILISFLGINNENILDIIRYLFKYFISQKVILYWKNNKTLTC